MSTATTQTAQPRLRVRYPLAAEAIDVRVEIERHGRHWYRSDRLHRATAAATRDGTPAGPR